MEKIKVLIVDDSLLICKLLEEIFSTDNGLEVVGFAQNPYVARDKIKALKPDVITLDVEMPKMDGVTFLKNLMRLHPMPVVMVSTLTEKGGEITLKALEFGAVDFVHKPSSGVSENLKILSEEIIEKVKSAAGANLAAFLGNLGEERVESKQVVPKTPVKLAQPASDDSLIVIGSSTGGTEAIRKLLQDLPDNLPPIVISQHIPPGFSEMFVKRINELLPQTVLIAEHDQQLSSGHVYVAPGGRHLAVIRRGGLYYNQLSDKPPVNRHRPSVEVLFESAAKCAGENVICLMLTGMGDDGALGAQSIHNVGGKVLVQDEETSVVWGMPGSVVKLGCHDEILPLHEMPHCLVKLL